MLRLTSFNNKNIKNILILFVVITLFFTYIYSIYLDIQDNYERNIQKSLVLKYEIYKKLIKKDVTPVSLLIENPNYVNNSELVEEMKKSTPLMTSIENYEDAKFDITFKFIDKNKKENQQVEKYKNSLIKSGEEYIIFFDTKTEQVSLLGILENKGFVLINQNNSSLEYLALGVNKILIFFLLFGVVSMGFFLYLLYLKQKLQARAFNLNETYEKLYDDTKKLALEDKLTKAATRLKFDETLKDLIQVASRFEEQVFCVIMIDIDNFKSVNDTYGHDYGDIVLQSVASIILKHKRSSETFARWGGEEFVIISPLTKLENSVEFANKLRVEISNIEFEKLQRVTCSFGVSEYMQGDSEKTIMKRADEFLYEAKLNGKNRVEY